MRCRYCGESIDRDSKFCRYCGEKVDDITNQSEVTKGVQYFNRESFVSKVTRTTIELVVSILILINFFSGIIGGVWLAFSGGFSLVIYGIILSIVMPWAYTIAFLPQMGSMYIFSKLEEGGNKILLSIFGFVVSIYGNIILAIWSVFVFKNLVVGHSQHVLPLLLWGYSTVMSPLSYMASKELPDSPGTSLGLLFVQFTYLLLTILLFVGTTDATRNILLLIISALFSFVSASVVYSSLRARTTPFINKA